ncbi:class I SAM-dependent methyltransferase [Streptomyces sp. TS71-3]|uniref:class I SAM-dependent methyltransferase n=1 Tax=Streptomyces sp. TS71-3 TaxID=2733862 RepID=UPI001B0CA6D5|nr:class I SAM-dependent methyltransferase [Streptomyces sp. TS71-3]GHJ41762.1 hypothetical protein Sm713_73710 [Streptomyces sp. TS71-3]
MNDDARVAGQYEEIGGAYERFKSLPVSRCVEQPSILGLFGDLHGRSVLDLACGTGFYARHARALGASRVLGVDVSEAMLGYARNVEARQAAGIEYLAADAAALPASLGAFDVVTAVFLLNYAADQEQMTAFFRSARRHLAADGVFLAYVMNPDFAFERPWPAKYGLEIAVERRLPDGVQASATADFDPPMTLRGFVPARRVYEAAAAAAGFGALQWVPVRAEGGTDGEFPAGFWDDLLSNPPWTMLRARPAAPDGEALQQGPHGRGRRASASVPSVPAGPSPG